MALPQIWPHYPDQPQLRRRAHRRTVRSSDTFAIRGSSSRDEGPGLRNMQRAYLSGHYCAFTADGPRGPAMVAKPGAAQLAELVNTTVRTCYIHPHSAWQLRSWDRFLIPKPFSRVAIAWTLPAPADLPSVQAALDRSVELAQSMKK